MIREIIPDRLWTSHIPRDVRDVAARKIDVLITMSKKTPPDDVVGAVEAWHHIPMADGQTLDAAAVVDAGSRVVSYVAVGKRVMINCLLGRNRSCLVAAYVLVRRGLSGPEALRRIRELRPDAVKNPVMEAWLVQQRTFYGELRARETATAIQQMKRQGYA